MVMGFGCKTDYRTQRVLDLDRTYRHIIRPAVKAAGLECIRGDDVIHAGLIERPMYDFLFHSDLVIADLSTSNENAIYELGVRHALRPHTTIILAEKQFPLPFDLKSVMVRTYEHLGNALDVEEVDRCRTELENAIRQLLANPTIDSPVFTFLGSSLNAKAPAARAIEPAPGNPHGPSASTLLLEARTQALEASTQALRARAEESWSKARSLWSSVARLLGDDPFVLQQQALATYKSREPDTRTALHDAIKILERLNPHVTHDTETLGLWGAVHKRLYEDHGGRKQDLDEALRAYGRGFELNRDHYTGINYAYLLNVRARRSMAAPADAMTMADAIADWVLAQRVRHEIIPGCRAALLAGIKDDEGRSDPMETFWRQATLIEAYVGTRQDEKAAELEVATKAAAPESWMRETLELQLGKLRALLQESPLDRLMSIARKGPV